MSSSPPEPLDLESDLPTTAEDVAALRQVRGRRRLGFVEYLEFLSRIDLPARGRRREISEGEPFEL